MRSDHKSLSDLFRAARSEAGPDLVKPDEIQRLLGNSVMPHIPLMSRIGQHLSERLLSTPFRLGTTMMTTATLATIGGITLHSLLFGSVGQGVVKHSPLNTPSKVAATLSSNSQDNKITIGSPVSHVVLHPTAQKTVLTEVPAIVKDSKSDPALDSLKPIDLSVDQLNRLGVVLLANGDITVYEKMGNNVTPYTFPPNRGIRLGLGEHLTLQSLPGVQVLDVMPKLITEPDGVKRFFSFEKDTSLLKLVDGMMDSIHLYTKVQVVGDGETEDTIDGKPAISVGVIRKEFKDTAMWAAEVKNLGVDDSMLQSLKRGVQISIGSDDDSSLVPKWPNGIQEEINVDSLLQSAGVNTSGKGKNIKIRIESSDSGSAGKLPEFGTHLFQNMQKSVKGFGHIMEQLQHSNGKLQHLMQDIKFTMDAEFKLDRLIPIRVRNMNDAGHPNELIFWYEPTSEVTNLLPATAYTHTEAKPQHVSLSVYPNPTNGLSAIHYELKDVQQANFSIYNLLGQKLLDAGSTSGTMGDSKIDLSSLDAGMYLLVTTTDNGDREIERIVLAK